MKRLTSTVRQLAERHARLQAEAALLERLVAELPERLARVHANLAAVTLLLPAFDRRVDPSCIQPIAGWAGRYGERGSLRATIVAILKSRGEQWTSSNELSALLRSAFDMTFPDGKSQRDWELSSVRGALKRLQADGVVEKAKLGARHSDVTCWRMAQRRFGGSLADLLAESETLAAGSAR